jgi:hypothetical protein
MIPMRKSQKWIFVLHDYTFPFVFAGLCLLHVNMLVGLSYVFRG